MKATETHTTRRAVLAGAAAVIPTTAIAAGNPDAELIEIGRQLEPLLPQYLAASFEAQEKMGDAHALAEERTGTTIPTKRYLEALGQAEQELSANEAGAKRDSFNVYPLANRALK